MKNNIFKVWIGTSIAIIVILSVITKSSIFQIIAAVFGILYLYCNVIENKYGQICGVINTGIYGVIMFSTGLYGTAVYDLLYCVPMQIYTFFTWGKDKTGKNKKEISRYTNVQREMGLIAVVIVILIYTAVATKLNVNFALIDGISIILGALGMYFTSQKKVEQWYLFIINNIAMIFLWVIKVMESTSNLPMLLMWIVYLINNTYGLISWNKKLKTNTSDESK